MSSSETKIRGSAMTVERLASELVDPAWPIDRALVQFVMDWRRFPEQREAVVATSPPAGTDEVVAAKEPRWFTRCVTVTVSRFRPGSTAAVSMWSLHCSGRC